MSKRKKELTNNKDNKNNEVVESQPKSKFEKIFISVIFAVAAILIIVVVICNINTGGDKNILARKYKSLKSDNVFEIVTFDEFKTKINNKENFHLVLINSSQKDANYYIYCVDDIVREINKSSEENMAIYVLDSSNLEKKEKSYMRVELELEKEIFDSPNVIMFTYDEDIQVNTEHSVDGNSTDRYKLEKYEDNYWNLLVQFFKDCESEEK